MADSNEAPYQPSALWRTLSSTVMFNVGGLCRAFLLLCSKTEVNGLEPFLELVDSRRDPTMRERGLVTVSNHISVMDDPILWGVLPMRYHLNPQNHRFAFGSHDLCYSNRGLASFFMLGQVLPTHRLFHSVHGGLFQPTLTQAVRILSNGPFRSQPYISNVHTPMTTDPFSDLPLKNFYTTTGQDQMLAPSSYACNRFGWVHIHPEGMVHQAKDKTMRYFKWGVARLILEPEVCPDVVPIWIEGFDDVMHEEREAPRWAPRPGNEVSVTFGQKADREATFGDLRSRWAALKAKTIARRSASKEVTSKESQFGLVDPELIHDKEAVELRKETTLRVRELVLAVRRTRGLPDEDPKQGKFDTWLREGGNREGKMDDGTWVKDT